MQGIWTILLTMQENGYRQALGIIGNNGNVSAFCLGSKFSVKNSEKLLKSFKRSRIEKDANNTTYISCEKFQMEMWGKKWGKMQEIANNKFPQFA